MEKCTTNIQTFGKQYDTERNHLKIYSYDHSLDLKQKGIIAIVEINVRKTKKWSHS